MLFLLPNKTPSKIPTRHTGGEAQEAEESNAYKVSQRTSLRERTRVTEREKRASVTDRLVRGWRAAWGQHGGSMEAV